MEYSALYTKSEERKRREKKRGVGWRVKQKPIQNEQEGKHFVVINNILKNTAICMQVQLDEKNWEV